MKKTLSTALLALTIGLATAQKNKNLPNKNETQFIKNYLGMVSKKEKSKIGNYIFANSLIFTSGFFDGTAETLKFHYPNFKNRFPNANDDYWDPEKSWRNKYKNNDPNQGSKFPLSTSGLVFLTDGYHLSRFARNSTMIVGITFKIGEKKKWHQYALDGLIKYGLYTAGFALSYDVLFKKSK